MAVWFITGASRGLGRSIARAALDAGDEVVAALRDPARLDPELAASPSVLAVPLDVTEPAQVHEAIASAVARFGRIDVLVNNAGHGLIGPIEETSDAEARHVYDVNVFGLLNVTRAALPVLRGQGEGRIVNIGSMGGFAAFAATGVYASTKFAVEAITESLNAELAGTAIRAIVVEPGQFRTDFLDASSMVATAAPRIAHYDTTVTPVIDRLAGFNHEQPGDPHRAALAIRTVVAADDPPTRLPLGSDAIERIENKLGRVQRELDAWRALGESTAFA